MPSPRDVVRRLLDTVGLRRPVNAVRHTIMRPDWWVAQRARRRFFGSLIAPGDVVFDIGANVGQLTAVFRECGARVIAVEPQPGCVETLRQTFPEVIVHACVLSATQGSVELRVVPEESQLASASDAWIEAVSRDAFAQYRWTDRLRVPATTLDALIAEHGVPALCKIDVEGAEPDVLAGLSQPLPLLSFECTPVLTGHFEACVHRLGELGTYAFHFAPHGVWPEPAWGPPREPAEGGDCYARRID